MLKSIFKFKFSWIIRNGVSVVVMLGGVAGLSVPFLMDSLNPLDNIAYILSFTAGLFFFPMGIYLCFCSKIEYIEGNNFGVFFGNKSSNKFFSWDQVNTYSVEKLKRNGRIVRNIPTLRDSEGINLLEEIPFGMMPQSEVQRFTDFIEKELGTL